jgi:hypothetical protein
MIVLLGVFYFACVKLSDSSDTVLLVNYGGRFTLGLGQNDIDKVLFEKSVSNKTFKLN